MTPGVFLPDRDPRFYLLRQHRQPLAANVAREYVQAFTAPGDLVVDPFAASATVARAAVELGRRAIAVDSNPLVAFAARVQAALPAPREIAIALGRLGEVKKEDESLRTHLEELYAGVCANCGRPVTYEYLIHARGQAPLERIYHCRSCGARRDPATEADRRRAAEFQPRSFQYHLLLERIAADETTHSPLLRELLKLYTPRNLYALVTVTLKLDAEFSGDPAREILTACLLHALDVGTTLYPAPGAQPERQTPETFVEMNIWQALEQAAAGFSESAPGLDVAPSPAHVAQTPAPTLFVGHGSARTLVEALAPVPPSAALVLSSPARLDPRFWELSYLWTRWTLGKAAARPLEAYLEEDRQRWGWYGRALTSSLRAAAHLSRREGRMVLCFPSGSHAMIEALCLAAAPVFRLETFAFRPQRGAAAASEFGAVRGDYRVVWSRADAEAAPKPAQGLSARLRSGALHAATEILSARGDPLAYSWLHHNILRELAREGALAETLALNLPHRDNPFQFLRREIEAGLKEGYARDLDHWKEPGRVLWLRRQAPPGSVPLADRVEQVVRELARQASAPGLGHADLEDAVLARLPELLTPEPELITASALACAETREGEWRWRTQDEGEELARGQLLVAALGARLGFEVSRGGTRFDLLWWDEKVVPASSGGSVAETRIREESHGFIFRARVDLPGLARNPPAALRGLVVIPESQVELLRERLRRSPPLFQAWHAAGWDFMRVPFVERLLNSASAERAEFQLALGLEPAMVKDKKQMELF